jgi:hypothetical protein
LKTDELRAACDASGLPFRSTAELTPMDGLIGQERALEAVFESEEFERQKAGTKREAGHIAADGRYPEGSFNAAVAQTLIRNLEQLKTIRAASAATVPPSA